MKLSFFKKPSKHAESQILKLLDFEETSRVLIINVDDVGMHKSVNNAAFDLYDKGRVSSMSVMASTPATDEAIEEIKKRDIPVGVHLTLTNEWQENYPWTAVLSKNLVPTLYNSKNLLWTSVEEVVENATTQDVVKELSAQVEKLADAGLTLSHLDTHMIFTERNQHLMDCYIKVAGKYNLPIVLQLDIDIANYSQEAEKLKKAGFSVADSYTMLYDRKLARENPNRRMRTYFQTIKNLPAGVHHLVIHPAMKCREQENELFDFFLRYHDYHTFIHNKMRKLLSGFTMINYTELKNLHE